MTAFSREQAVAKSDKALLLWERDKLSYSAIAERLSVKPCNVAGMLQRARQRREKAKETAE